jgi:excisionase family DNA binding protein
MSICGIQHAGPGQQVASSSDMFDSLDDALTTAQAALRLGVSAQTVQKWVDAGMLEAFRTIGGHRRIPARAVQALLDQRSGPATSSVAAGSATASARAPAEPGERPATPGKVLIVEDDPDTADLILALVRGLYPEALVRVVDDGFSGLIEAGHEPPELLIADVNLPGMDGLAMLTSLCQHAALRDTVMVVVKSHRDTELAQFGLVPEGVPVLRKPLQATALKTAWLGGRRTAAPVGSPAELARSPLV